MLKLDNTDIEILTLLHRNGRLSNVSLAGAVGLSPPASLHRVKRMESAGLITHYQAGINIKMITSALTVFAEVTLSSKERSDYFRFEKSLNEIPEVMECHLITGGYDYLIRIVARSISHYQDVISGVMDANIGVAKYFSYIVISSPFIRKTMPLELLIPRIDDDGVDHHE